MALPEPSRSGFARIDFREDPPRGEQRFQPLERPFQAVGRKRCPSSPPIRSRPAGLEEQRCREPLVILVQALFFVQDGILHRNSVSGSCIDWRRMETTRTLSKTRPRPPSISSSMIAAVVTGIPRQGSFFSHRRNRPLWARVPYLVGAPALSCADSASPTA